MAEISKPDFQYVWASGGSIVAPSNVKIQTGWTAEVPPFQWENWSQNRQDAAISHILQKGISVWSATGEYYFTTSGERSYVQGSDGNIYVAVADSVGQDPTTDAVDAYWKIAFTTPTTLSSSIALSGPIVGITRNTVMSVTTAAASATLTADEVVVKSALGGTTRTLNSFSKTINLATVGVGGMDTGTAPVSGYVALYAIYNPTTDVSALLAKNATSSAQTEVYTGANMPSGYTLSSLVAVWPTDGSSLLKAGYQQGRFVWIPAVTVISTTTAQASLTSLNVAAAIPMNAKVAKVGTNISAVNTGVTMTTSIAGSSTGIGVSTSATTSTSGGAGLTATVGNIPIITPQTIYYIDSVGSGAIAGFTINISGYEF